MPPEATLPPSAVNVPGDYFSMAGFEVTSYGRFWVTTEGLDTTIKFWDMKTGLLSKTFTIPPSTNPN